MRAPMPSKAWPGPREADNTARVRADIAALLEDAAQQRTAGYLLLAKNTLHRAARLRRELVQMTARGSVHVHA